MKRSNLRAVAWTFCPGHAGVRGNGNIVLAFPEPHVTVSDETANEAILEESLRRGEKISTEFISGNMELELFPVSSIPEPYGGTPLVFRGSGVNESEFVVGGEDADIADHPFQAALLHTLYRDNGYDYDIAMLTLSSRMTITRKVQTIRLANFFDGLGGTDCILSGYGRTINGESRFQLELLDGRVQVLRRRGQRFQDASVVKAARHGGYSVIVWDGSPLIYRGPGVNSDDGFIVGGEDANISDYPYQAALLRRSGNTYFQFCGGSLLTTRKVITAAHCIDPSAEGSVYVMMGATDLTNSQDPMIQLIEVDEVDIHSDYVQFGLDYDIAMLTLSSRMVITTNVATIRLANFFDGLNGSDCVLSGYGRTVDGGPTSPVLQSSPFTVYSLLRCIFYWFRSTGRFLVNYRELCVINPDTSGCQGDSGGPLVCNGRLTGIVSWGTTSCKVGAPSVYTRVHVYIFWILFRLF
ncbi:coagulation factor X-like [Aplysia californica]|uniref:Coagulation factor X-like n=1 Tax=Aplysia californica TaxID=6500 RepID=A0ABM1VP32_APLCA|nr:coagulation factor X-like [Aplysia californica]